MRTIKPDRETEIRAATEALVQALLRAIEDAQPAPVGPDRLLSVDEAAAALGLGRSKVYDEIGAGRLKSFRVGRRRLLGSGDLAAYVAARAAE